MTEGVLAVDARLKVTFCNQAFLGAMGDHARRGRPAAAEDGARSATVADSQTGGGFRRTEHPAVQLSTAPSK